MPSLDFESEKISFREYYDKNLIHFDQAKEAFLTLINCLLASDGLSIVSANGRVKDREESIRKFTRKYQSKLEEENIQYEIRDHITDLIGLRLVCLYEDDIDRIGEFARNHFNVIDVTNKTDEIEKTENSFGYKGLHLDLKMNDDRADLPEYRMYSGYQFELQIRTIIQDSWSTLDSKIKYKKSIPSSLKRRINTLAALFELADREFREVRDQTAIQIEIANDEPEPEGINEEKNVGTLHLLNETDEVERGHFAPLNSFRLLRIARHFFPDFEFDEKKVDGFTTEIIEREPSISRGKLNHYLRSNIGLVRRYRAKFLESGKGDSFNAFTEMRHALYAANPENFQSMLTNLARISFDAWCNENEQKIR